MVVSSGVVSEIVGLETEVPIVGVELGVMKVGMGVNISGCKVVSEILGVTTEVMMVGLELTIVVDEGGLVCVTLLVVGFIVVSELVGLETEVLIGYGTVELETIGFEVVCVMVGLTTEVMIVALELEAPGFKVVSNWGVGLVLVIEVSGFKDVVGPSVMMLVEGFKVVSATVTDGVRGAVVIGVNEATVSDCWLLLLAVVPCSEVVSLTLLKLVVLINSVDVSGSEMDNVVDFEVETFSELTDGEASVEALIVIELGFEVLSVEDGIVGSTDEGVF